MIILFSSVNGVSLIFIISGTVGPNISASRIPTVFPSSDKDTAKFTAVVVFPGKIELINCYLCVHVLNSFNIPTPPFPELTTIIFLTSFNILRCGNDRCISSI